MTSWPIGLSTGCFYHQSILDCLPLIRESGFSMIEVCSSPEHLDFHDPKSVERAAKRINELGMEAYSFHAPFAPRIDIASSDEGQRLASVAEIFKAAEAASLLRVHYFVLHPGPENPAVVAPEEQLPRLQHLIASLNQVASHCKELGIMCVLENKLPHLIFGKPSDILWILDGINSTEVGFCLDTGHAFFAGQISDLVRKVVSGYLRMIHAHDNNGTNDDHLPPGDGKINWNKFLRDLIEFRFRGAFILEMAGNSDSSVTMANARRGRTYLRKVARELALKPR
jgi:sugar phosphate isomerase/epimerase